MDNQRQPPDTQPGIPASGPWRGRSRPADIATVKICNPCEDALSESPARDRGAWRDPNHGYEDHEVLRCPWPGGLDTFSRPWRELTAEAAAMGLASTLSICSNTAATNVIKNKKKTAEMRTHVFFFIKI